jgi:hypothetical protein
MSKTKRTPGPWYLTKNSSQQVELHGENWNSFAEIIVRMFGSQNDCQDGIANANAIVMAPELIDCCEKALSDLEYLLEGFDSKNDQYPSIVETINSIESVLKKVNRKTLLIKPKDDKS